MDDKNAVKATTPAEEKKAPVEKKAEKPVPVPVARNRYELTPAGKEYFAKKELRGQKAVILPHVRKGGMTFKEIVAAVTPDLQTNSTPDRIVAWYLMQWRQMGLAQYCK